MKRAGSRLAAGSRDSNQHKHACVFVVGSRHAPRAFAKSTSVAHAIPQITTRNQQPPPSVLIDVFMVLRYDKETDTQAYEIVFHFWTYVFLVHFM